jgi:anti-sigma regulatory factor (Ser/Thr protein kinase)
MGKGRTDEVRRAILAAVFWSSASPVARVARQFSITKQAVLLHVQALVREQVLQAEGERRHRRYALREVQRAEETFDLSGGAVEEHAVWSSFAKPLILPIATANDLDVCGYGLTEMINNGIDHSSGSVLTVGVVLTTSSITMRVTDNGVGIFQKIAEALGLADPRLSLLELSKGKFTTDAKRHTGEGIFFTSRAFDRFTIRSSNLLFSHTLDTGDWLVDIRDKAFVGTRIAMSLFKPTPRSMHDVYKQFTMGGEDSRFAKTHVPLELATFGDESLVSRSSAKRVLSRAERFEEVLLDFSGVRSIGQGFADEIFRVFANEHPAVKLIAINANEQVTGMIRRAQSARDEQQKLS